MFLSLNFGDVTLSKSMSYRRACLAFLALRLGRVLLKKHRQHSVGLFAEPWNKYWHLDSKALGQDKN